NHGLEQSFLRSELAVDGHLRDAGVGGDGVDAGPLQTVRIEVAPRRFHDAPEALRVARPAATRLGRDIVLGWWHRLLSVLDSPLCSTTLIGLSSTVYGAIHDARRAPRSPSRCLADPPRAGRRG